MEETTALVTHYMGNAKIIRETFEGIGLKCHGGTNAPYVFVHFPGQDSWDVFKEILEKVQVVTTPGAGFGPAGQGFVRVSGFGHRESVSERDNECVPTMNSRTGPAKQKLEMTTTTTTTTTTLADDTQL